jgi:UDP-glucose 4-epimerase
MKKILVTGAAGFLGSHLVDALLRARHEVVAVDNLSQGSLRNLELAQKSSNFQFHKLDVCDLDALRSVARGVEVVAHLAAYKIPRYGKAMDTLLINSQGSHNVLQVASDLGAKVLVTSTSDVYGKNPSVPFSETSDSVIGTSTVARWGYAVSKLFDEHLAFAFADDCKIPVTIIRVFGSYGPRHHLSWWGGPQSVFIDSVLRGEVIPIHGDGLQTRSFTFVSDTVAGIQAAIENDAANGEIFNIGSTHEISILELARVIHRLSGVPGELQLEFVPYEKISSGRSYEDVRRRVPDVRKAERLLGFKARVELENGLARTIEWQRAFRAAERDCVVAPR